MAEPEDILTSSNGQEEPEGQVPSGILRLREEWHRAGLPVFASTKTEADSQPVVFPASDDGVPVGDYTLTEDDVRNRLSLSPEALDRLLNCGELDSIRIRGNSGIQRLVSVSSFDRFVTESAMDPRTDEPLAKSLMDTLEVMRQEIDSLKNSQAKQLQQVKDMVLLELRNLKEQDRDLASYVYEMTQVLEELLPKRKKRR